MVWDVSIWARTLHTHNTNKAKSTSVAEYKSMTVDTLHGKELGSHCGDSKTNKHIHKPGSVPTDRIWQKKQMRYMLNNIN